MSDFLDVLLDAGYDYGASGGPDDFGTEISIVGRRSIANQRYEHPLGQWELGQREVTATRWKYFLDHWHTVRGRAHRFRYLDWNDYHVTSQALAIDGTATVQLTKTYGVGGINDYVADIVLPLAASLVIETNIDGAGWSVLTEGVGYSIAETTGVLTWLGDAPDPNEGDQARWSGTYHKKVRFGVDRLTAQFLAYRSSPRDGAYALGPLTVREDRSS